MTAREFKKATRWDYGPSGLGIGNLVMETEGRKPLRFRENGDLIEYAWGVRPYAEEWEMVGNRATGEVIDGEEILDLIGIDFPTLLRRFDRAEEESAVLREEERSRIERALEEDSPGRVVGAVVRRFVAPVRGWSGDGSDGYGNRVIVHPAESHLEATDSAPTYCATVVYEGSTWAYDFAEYWGREGRDDLVIVEALSSYEIGLIDERPEGGGWPV